jgi:hypothetical protein
MPDRDGVEIYKRFYPWPDSFRLGDPVLVKEITGMRWPDFVQALDDQNQAIADAEEMGGPTPQPDQVVLAGLVAVAFWQGNPTMSRDKARRALERIPMEDIEVIDGDEGEADLIPPAEGSASGGAEQPTTSNGSEFSPEQYTETTLPGSSSDETSPNGSGLPGSPTTSPESLPA